MTEALCIAALLLLAFLQARRIRELELELRDALAEPQAPADHLPWSRVVELLDRRDAKDWREFDARQRLQLKRDAAAATIGAAVPPPAPLPSGAESASMALLDSDPAYEVSEEERGAWGKRSAAPDQKHAYAHIEQLARYDEVDVNRSTGVVECVEFDGDNRKVTIPLATFNGYLLEHERKAADA